MGKCRVSFKVDHFVCSVPTCPDEVEGQKSKEFPRVYR